MGRILIAEPRTVRNVDASLERTRMTFASEGEGMYLPDQYALKGFVPVVPGMIVMVTIEVVGEGGA